MYERGLVVKLSFDERNPDSRSRTKQSFAADADINRIMSRYPAAKAGQVVLASAAVNSGQQGYFGDFSDVGDFASIVSRIQAAQDAFQLLPAAVRERFGNNVAQCLDFVAEDANLEESVELGLLPDSDARYVKLLSDRKVKEELLLKKEEPPKVAPPAFDAGKQSDLIIT